MPLNLRYFASIRETVGRSGEVYDGGVASLAELRDALIARGEPYVQALGRGRAVRMAVDHVMRGENFVPAEGAEVAFFPPVTGG